MNTGSNNHNKSLSEQFKNFLGVTLGGQSKLSKPPTSSQMFLEADLDEDPKDGIDSPSPSKASVEFLHSRKNIDNVRIPKVIHQSLDF